MKFCSPEFDVTFFMDCVATEKWLKLLEDDMATNGGTSRLSANCLHFIHSLIATEPDQRLKINEILTHPFLTEEVDDKLGYDNWYSDDTVPDDLDIITMEEDGGGNAGDTDTHSDGGDEQPFIEEYAGSILVDLPQSPPTETPRKRKREKVDAQRVDVDVDVNVDAFECIVKEQLLQHKVSLICGSLMNDELSYYPRIMALNKLISVIKECCCTDSEKAAYPNIGRFILAEFEKPFAFQLEQYRPSSARNDRKKAIKKMESLQKRCYSVIIEMVKYIQIAPPVLAKYVNIMMDHNETAMARHRVLAGKSTANTPPPQRPPMNRHFVTCIHRVIKEYALQYESCLVILQIIGRFIKQSQYSGAMRLQCISFLRVILMQFIQQKEVKPNGPNGPDREPPPEILQCISYGLMLSDTKQEAENLLRAFRAFSSLDRDIDRNQHTQSPTVSPSTPITRIERVESRPRMKPTEITESTTIGIALNTPLPPSLSTVEPARPNRPRNGRNAVRISRDRSATPRARKISSHRGRRHRKFKSMDMDSEHRIDFSDLDIISVMEPSVKSIEREGKVESIKISRIGDGVRENECKTQSGSPPKKRSKRRPISRGSKVRNAGTRSGSKSKSKSGSGSGSESKHQKQFSLQYMSLNQVPFGMDSSARSQYTSPRTRRRRRRNTKEFVLESKSEIPDFDDVCATASPVQMALGLL